MFASAEMKRGLSLTLVVLYAVGGRGQIAHEAPTVQRASIASRDDSRLVDRHAGKAIVRTAWKHRRELDYQPDCSHLVHQIYDLAGLGYPYATSDELYQGISHFRQVRAPQAGDLIVWPGHVGIVVDPGAHSFYSSLRSGLKIDFYNSRQWKKRVPARFYRAVVSGRHG